MTTGGNLTISSTLQAPVISLLGVSSSVMDGKVGTIIGVSISQFLTRNETIIPPSFLVWGNDYTTDKYIKNSGKLTISSNTTNNVIQIENSS